MSRPEVSRYNEALPVDVAPSHTKFDPLGGVIPLQSATDVGSGPARSLRWRNTTSSAISDELVRVASNGCTTNCGPDDQYRIRAYETTYTIARFDNTSTSLPDPPTAYSTSLILQNPTELTVQATLYFWEKTGTLLGSHSLPLDPKSVNVVITTTAVPAVSGKAGSVTVASNAPYGRLSGKATTVESFNGLTFDTPMEPRRR